MGDHRASVKIAFTFHGRTYTMDSYLNWSDWGSEEPGVDQRVIEFFREATRDGLRRYDEQESDRIAKARAADTEARERAELQRLQAKYQNQ